MLTVYRNEDGQIQFAAEARCVDATGALANDGAYLWVEQIECNRGLRAWPYIRRYMRECCALMPHLQYTYWVRRDTTGAQFHGLYTRRQILRFANRQEEVFV